MTHLIFLSKPWYIFITSGLFEPKVKFLSQLINLMCLPRIKKVISLKKIYWCQTFEWWYKIKWIIYIRQSDSFCTFFYVYGYSLSTIDPLWFWYVTFLFFSLGTFICECERDRDLTNLALSALFQALHSLTLYKGKIFSEHAFFPSHFSHID